MEQTLTIDINSDELASNLFLGERIYCDFYSVFKFRGEEINQREYELDIMNRFIKDVHTPEYLRNIIYNTGTDMVVQLIPEGSAPEFHSNVPVKCQIIVIMGNEKEMI